VLSCGQHRLSVLFVFDHFERDLCNIVSIGTFCLIFVCCLFLFDVCLLFAVCLIYQGLSISLRRIPDIRHRRKLNDLWLSRSLAMLAAILRALSRQLLVNPALAPVLEMSFCNQPSGAFVHATNLRHLVRTPWTLVGSLLVAQSVWANSDKQRRRIAFKTRRRKSKLRDFHLSDH
jgi:hypothetical protein